MVFVDDGSLFVYGSHTIWLALAFCYFPSLARSHVYYSQPWLAPYRCYSISLARSPFSCTLILARSRCLFFFLNGSLLYACYSKSLARSPFCYTFILARFLLWYSYPWLAHGPCYVDIVARSHGLGFFEHGSLSSIVVLFGYYGSLRQYCYSSNVARSSIVLFMVRGSS